MKLFKKILVPYDNTKASDQALDYALDIAESSDDCKIILLHVITPMSPPIPASETMAASIRHRDYLNKIYEDLETSASVVLEAKKKSIIQKAGKVDAAANKISSSLISAHVIVGESPAKKIADYARLHDVDLIVISSRNTIPKNRIKRWLWVPLGSVSRTVSELAPCPVLLVRPL